MKNVRFLMFQYYLFYLTIKDYEMYSYLKTYTSNEVYKCVRILCLPYYVFAYPNVFIGTVFLKQTLLKY